MNAKSKRDIVKETIRRVRSSYKYISFVAHNFFSSIIDYRNSILEPVVQQLLQNGSIFHSRRDLFIEIILIAFIIIIVINRRWKIEIQDFFEPKNLHEHTRANSNRNWNLRTTSPRWNFSSRWNERAAFTFCPPRQLKYFFQPGIIYRLPPPLGGRSWKPINSDGVGSIERGGERTIAQVGDTKIPSRRGGNDLTPRKTWFPRTKNIEISRCSTNAPRGDRAIHGGRGGGRGEEGGRRIAIKKAALEILNCRQE